MEAVVLALKFESSPICWYNSLKFDLISEADDGAAAAEAGGVVEVIVGLGKSLRLRPPWPRLVPDVPVLEDDEDNLPDVVWWRMWKTGPS